MSRAEKIDVVVEGVRLSAILRRAQGDPRGTIVALHGGRYSAEYWNDPVTRQHSLLDLGAGVGFNVLAVDRPGYGASFGHPADRGDAAAQSALLLRMLAELPGQLDVGRSIFVIGHSMGGIVAIHMAANDTEGRIHGVAVSGLPLRFPEGMPVNKPLLTTGVEHLPAVDRDHMRRMFYGPEGTWDPSVLDYDHENQRPCPVAEFRDAVTFPAMFEDLAAQVRIPIQVVIAEHEASSVGGESTLRRASEAMVGSPRCESWIQPATGHNISLHHVAGAYHLRALGFFEECRATQPG